MDPALYLVSALANALVCKAKADAGAPLPAMNRKKSAKRKPAAKK